MTCAGCERTVESILESRPGVSAAQANRSTERVSVSYDDAATSPAALVAAINDNTYYRASLPGSSADAAPASIGVRIEAAGGAPLLVALAVLIGAGGLALHAIRRPVGAQGPRSPAATRAARGAPVVVVGVVVGSIRGSGGAHSGASRGGATDSPHAPRASLTSARRRGKPPRRRAQTGR